MDHSTFIVVAFGVGFVASVSFVVAVQRVARRAGLIDVPNERSLHRRPTPRGGGIGLALAVVVVLIASNGRAAWLPAAAILLVTLVGILDDLYSLSIPARLAAHVVAGALLAANARVLDIGFAGGGHTSALDSFAWLIWTVVLINLVNFMDGADTLIGVQAVIFSAFALALLADQSAAAVAGCLLGASLGFLVFNLPPAGVFLGDVGSGSLGVIFAYLGMLIMERRGVSVARAFIPLLPLFVDEGLTMLRRLSLGESLFVAHRKHLYQLLVSAGWGHARVGLVYALCSLVAASWALGARDAVGYHLGAAALTVLVALIMGWRRRSLEAGTS